VTYTVRCWCVENNADGEFTLEARSRIDAIEDAATKFRECCQMAGAIYVPPRHRIQTEVVGVGA